MNTDHRAVVLPFGLEPGKVTVGLELHWLVALQVAL